jgi:hypothetical protein
MIRKILIAVVAVVALLVGAAAPAAAAPNRNVAYSWTVMLTDPVDGEEKPAYLAAGVRYKKDGTVQTYCNYAFRRPYSFVADQDNLYYYNVDKVVEDTSRDGLFRHCMEAWLRGDADEAVQPA